ncbi:MAG: AraC family transcriptional regulator [Psychrobium sp.]
MIRVFEALGVSKESVLAGVEQLPDIEADIQATITGKQIIHIFQNISRLSIPAIGFRVGEKIRAKDYGIYGCTLISSQTLADALNFATKFHSLVTRTSQMFCEYIDDGSMMFKYKDLLGIPEIRLLNLEMQTAIQLALIRDMVGSEAFTPRCVYFEFPEPAHSDIYRQSLDCPIYFEQPFNGFEFSREQISVELKRHNPLAMPTLLQICAQQLEVTNRDKLLQKTYAWVVEHVGQRLSAESLAHYLCMTTRTLRRQLAEHGTSFNEICAEVKCRLAKVYIQESLTTVEDIATSLGFNDGASFRRAFKHWTGLTPAQYRRSYEQRTA